MGYSLYIGERTEIKEEDGSIYPTVNEVTISESPGGDVPTARTNGRWPSYSGWADFTIDTGLTWLMNELIVDHPGIADIKQEHLDAIIAVDKNKIHPYNKERIEWLEWWVKWALNNCEKPSFYNS